jgi:UDP-N-acetyl-D-mannosaminuronate dehydrogenase
LAYKPDVDDFRESPAVHCVELLQKAGANVRVLEPYLKDNIPGIKTYATAAETAQSADLILLLVNHSAFHQIDPLQLLPQTSARILFDTVNGWEKTTWETAGFKVFHLGSGKV